MSTTAGEPTSGSSDTRDGSPIPIVYVARGGHVDGSGRQLVYLLAHLDRGRFNPLVLLDTGGPLRGELVALGIDVRVTRMRPWRSLRGWPGRLFDARSSARLARAHDSRLVHCSDTWRTPYARFIARGLGVPLVAHVRGPTKPRDLRKNHCLRADTIVGIAERYREEIERGGYPADGIQIIDDAVDTATYRRDESARADVRSALGVSDRIVVGMAGRVEPLKRVAEFVEAIARVPRDIDATFLVIGATRREAYVREVTARIAALGLTERVRLIGRRDDMPAVLSGLDLLVTLSGGSVMFEAMACGVPVLSVRPDGRHSQHTEHNCSAWCVTSDDAQVTADELTRLLRDRGLRDRVAEAGRACVEARLSPAMMAQRTQAIYERLLVESRCSAR